VNPVPAADKTIKEGKNLLIGCDADDWYRWCKFTHVDSGSSCLFTYKSSSEPTVPECKDFQGRYAYI
jgi:hypothetical protein